MAGFYSGIDSALWVDGVKVGKAASWSLTASANLLPTTTLGDYAPTYRLGRQSYAGSCSIYFYEDVLGKVEGQPLLKTLLQTGKVAPDQKHRFKLTTGDRLVEFDAMLSSASLGASAGEVISVDVSFSVCGPLIQSTLGGI
jgi:hypothetical protein